MKYLLIFVITLIMAGKAKSIDPIPLMPWYITFNVSHPAYHYYKQFGLQQFGLNPGVSIDLGKRRFPIYLSYQYQLPIKFQYRNHRLIEQFHSIDLRYNLNNISYVIPYGIDPYVGVGLINQKSIYHKFELEDLEHENPVESIGKTRMNYKLSAGASFGNKRIIFGIQYDFIPSEFNLENDEGTSVVFYNSLHLVHAKIGIRLYTEKSRYTRCPRFKTKTKRSLKF